MVPESNKTDQTEAEEGVEVKEKKTHTHTRVVVSEMGCVVVITQEALPWVCPSQNRDGRL